MPPTSAALATQLSALDANKQSSADILNGAMAKYGVGDIQNRVSGLRTTLSNTETALNNVDPSVTGRTSNSLVTEAQRQRMVNQERVPIAAQYGDQTRALSNESANLGEAQKQADVFANGQISDNTNNRNNIQNEYNNATAREAEATRVAQADRAFQLQQSQAAESKVNSDRNYQLAVKNAATSASRASTASAAKAPKETVASLFDGYQPGKDNFYTEKVVIPTLISQGMSAKKAADTAYAYRLATFGKH